MILMQGLILYFTDFLIEMINSQNMIRFSLMFKTATVMLHIDQNIFVL